MKLSESTRYLVDLAINGLCLEVRRVGDFHLLLVPSIAEDPVVIAITYSNSP